MDTRTEDPIFSSREAAEYMGVTTRTIENYIANGELRAGRVGDGPRARIRIRRSECDRFLFGPEDEA